MRSFSKGVNKSFHSKRHIDHADVALNGIIQAEHKVRGALERAGCIALRLDHDNVDLRCNAHGAVAVHRRCNNTCHGGTVPLLVLDQRPVHRTVREYVVLNDLILGSIIRILADTSCKLGVVGVNTRIYHSNSNPRALRIRPDILHIQIVQICLAVIL